MQIRSILLLCAALLAVPSAAHAQHYPNRTIKLVVPFPPGGPTDILGRLIAQKMAEQLGQQVIVENKSGAGGSIGIETVVRATPDGYTLGYGSASTLAINASIYTLTYDPTKDLAPVGLVAVGPYTISVNPKMATSLKDFVAYAKANPGKLNMGSSGLGSSPHIAAVLFNDAAGLSVTHVPYKGGGPGLAGVMSGEVDFIFDAPITSKALADEGKLRILAVTGERRSSMLPDVPTVSEALIPGFTATTWNGLVAPAGTPPAIIETLSKALQAAVRSEEIQARFKEAGYEAFGNTPAEFAKFIDVEANKWSSAVKKAGVPKQ
jgi:tripartite-type tricarboxylate transporter receptor subunit TctC